VSADEAKAELLEQARAFGRQASAALEKGLTESDVIVIVMQAMAEVGQERQAASG
jgi:AmiR/NasT family two-component response regulator